MLSLDSIFLDQSNFGAFLEKNNWIPNGGLNFAKWESSFSSFV
jgi:hypothetical protein